MGLLAGSIHTTALAAQPAVVMAAGNPDLEKVSTWPTGVSLPRPPSAFPVMLRFVLRDAFQGINRSRPKPL